MTYSLNKIVKIIKSIVFTRKYPLRRYILGVLTHTTAWDQLLGGDVFLRLYILSSADHVILKSSIRSSALPRVAAVWPGFWNSDHMVLKSSIHSSALPCSLAVWLGFWNSDHVVLELSIRSSASPRSVEVWLAFWNSDHVVLKSSMCTSAVGVSLQF